MNNLLLKTRYLFKLIFFSIFNFQWNLWEHSKNKSRYVNLWIVIFFLYIGVVSKKVTLFKFIKKHFVMRVKYVFSNAEIFKLNKAYL